LFPAGAGKWDVCLFQAGSGVTLVLAAPPAPGHAASLLESVRPAVLRFRLSLPDAQEKPEPPLPDLEEMFGPNAVGTLDQKAVDAFWEQAVEESRPEISAGPGAIPYEQARQLGLTPEED
jgi:hypothetical protein